MIMKVYAVFDRIAVEFSGPLTAKNDAVAARMFLKSIDGQRPDEFRLYQVGVYDTESGHLEGIPDHVREVEVSSASRGEVEGA